MAEIRVTPKKKKATPAWLWIVLVLIIAAVVYFVVQNSNKDNTGASQTHSTSLVAVKETAGHLYVA